MAAFPRNHSTGSVTAHGTTRGLIVSQDEEFKRHFAALAARRRRSGQHRRRSRAGAETARARPRHRRHPRRRLVGDGDHRAAARRQPPAPASSRRAARRARPDPAGDARRRQRVLPLEPWRAARAMEETFHGAVRRTAARRETAQRRAGRRATRTVFFGAKGGAGTTTVAVNCGVELARLTQAADGHRRPEAGPRRGRAVPRRAAALQPARRDRQPAPARSRVPARAGRRSTSRASRSSPARISSIGPAPQDARRDRGAVPAARAAVRVHRRRRRQPDQLVRGRGALHGRHDLPGRQPGRAVDPQRAAAARARAPARRRRRARARAAQPRRRSRTRFRPSRSRRALGHPIHHTFPSDYKTVSTALNSGVPLALAGNSDIATQFDQLHAADPRVRTPTRRRRSRRSAQAASASIG